MEKLEAMLRPPSDSLKEDFNLWKEMYPIIKELRKGGVDNKERSLDGFVGWAKIHDIWNDKLEIRRIGLFGAGVFAIDHCELNELLVNVPQRLMITSEPKSNNSLCFLI
jgi:hypothetical protein